MQSNSLIFKSYYFEVAKKLENSAPPLRVEELCQSVGITEQELEEVFRFLQSLHLDFHVERAEGEKLVHYPAEFENAKATFHLSEMLSLYHMLSPKSDDEQGVHDSKEFLSKKVSSFFHSLAPKNPQKESDYQQWVRKIEEATLHEKSLQVKTSNEKWIELFPHRMVFIDEELHLICEECWDKCLVYIPLTIIGEVEIKEEGNYEKNFSKKEVEDFVSALGNLSGEAERIVLKIYDKEKVEKHSLNHCIVEEPFITTNAQQEVIWAANVLVSDELFEWLYQIREYIEILDPQNLISNYHEYLSKTGREGSQKKAS